MKEETRQILKKKLNAVNEKISDREDKVRNWNAVNLVGLVGGTIGVMSLDDGKIIAGMIVGIGGLVFKTINAIVLNDYEIEKEVLEYGLNHPDNVIEYDLFDEKDDNKGGKRFKK